MNSRIIFASVFIGGVQITQAVSKYEKSSEIGQIQGWHISWICTLSRLPGQIS